MDHYLVPIQYLVYPSFLKCNVYSALQTEGIPHFPLTILISCVCVTQLRKSGMIGVWKIESLISLTNHASHMKYNDVYVGQPLWLFAMSFAGNVMLCFIEFSSSWWLFITLVFIDVIYDHIGRLNFINMSQIYCGLICINYPVSSANSTSSCTDN